MKIKYKPQFDISFFDSFGFGVIKTTVRTYSTVAVIYSAIIGFIGMGWCFFYDVEDYENK